MNIETISKKDLENLYYAQELNDVQIADKLNTSKWQVWKKRKELGIKGVNPQNRKPAPNINSRHEEILVGSLFGDASIKGSSKSARYISISHSLKQKDYIDWLYEELKDISTSPPKPYTSKNGRYVTYSMITRAHPSFLKWRQELYTPDKQVTKEWANKLTPLPVAVWYMDDGCLEYVNNSKLRASFATNSFSYSSCQNLQEAMDSLGIKMLIEPVKKKNKFQHILVVADDSFDDFIEMVEKHIPDSMKYKIPGHDLTSRVEKIRPDIKKEDLIKLYFDEQKTIEEIGNVYELQKTTISKYFSILGIEPRSNSDAQKLSIKKRKRSSSGRITAIELSNEDLKKARSIFNQLKNIGFPYVEKKTEDQYIGGIERLKVKQYGSLPFQYSTTAMSLCVDHCPQIFDMSTNGSLTAKEIFNDDEKLFDCICRTIRYAKKDTIASVRSGLKTYRGNRSVSVFPPVWAKYVVDYLFDKDNLRVLDFSCGFGGRLIGSYASGKVCQYTGIDPLLCNISSHRDINNIINLHNNGKRLFNAKFINDKAENVLPELTGPYDLVLTSPPYFDKEVYDDKDQCYNDFSTYTSWLEEWLRPTLEHSNRLSPIAAIFISNTTKNNVGDDCENLMREIYNSVEILDFALPTLEYNRSGKDRNKKKEQCIIGS